jgi:hypothetical protein
VRAQEAVKLQHDNLDDVRKFWSEYETDGFKVSRGDQRQLFCQMCEIYQRTDLTKLSADDRVGFICAKIRCIYLKGLEGGIHPIQSKIVSDELSGLVDIIRSYRDFQLGNRASATSEEKEREITARMKFGVNHGEPQISLISDIADVTIRMFAESRGLGTECGPLLAVAVKEALALYGDSARKAEIRSKYQVFLEINGSNLDGPSLLCTATNQLRDKIRNVQRIKTENELIQLEKDLDDSSFRWSRGVELMGNNRAEALKVVEIFTNLLVQGAERMTENRDRCNNPVSEMARRMEERACETLWDTLRGAVRQGNQVALDRVKDEMTRLREKLLEMVLTRGWRQWNEATKCMTAEGPESRKCASMTGFLEKYVGDSDEVLSVFQQKGIYAQLAQVCALCGDDAASTRSKAKAGDLISDEILNRIRQFRQRVLR